MKESIKNLTSLNFFLKEKNSQLEVNQELLNSVINATDDLIFYKSIDNLTYIGCNKAFSNFLGVSKNFVIGSDNFDLFELIYADKLTKLDEKVLTNNKTYTHSQWLKRYDGENIYLEISNSPLKRKNGEIFGIVGVARDRTELRKTQEALIEATTKEIALLKYEERYHSVQQQNAFDKQLKIINDDLCNIKIKSLCIETFFQPLDILSGDSYASIHIGDGISFFCLVDAMGKGLSASVTSIQSISFINYSVKKSLENSDFNFKRVISDYQNYIKRHLLDDELVAILFMLYDNKNSKFYIANFGMPPILIHTLDEKVEIIKPNNTPIMSFLLSQNIDEYSVYNLKKILIYSDGLNESLTKENYLYEKDLEKDFLVSSSKKELLRIIKSKIDKYEDDVTFIFLNILPIQLTHIRVFKCKNSTLEIDNILQDVRGYFDYLEIDLMIAENLAFALYELVMNAYEHGNLGIDFELKDKLLQKDSYDEFLKSHSQIPENLNKNIEIKVLKHKATPRECLQIRIVDEGDGFNVAEIFKYLNFKKALKYNGRGILMSENLSDGVFYNFKGNEVTLIKYL